MALPMVTGGAPISKLTAENTAAAAEYPHDDDLVLRYNTQAGNVNTDNAFNNDESFYKALPLGNGRIGAMVYGNCPNELIDINECTVWSSGPGNNNKEGGANHIKLALLLLHKHPKIMEIVKEAVPSYQMDLIGNGPIPEHWLRMILFMFGITAISTIGGILIFKKSDLK